MEATPRRGATGWLVFAGTVVLLLGCFNFIDGLVALINDEYFNEELLFGDLALWGGVVLVIGAIQILVAMGIYSGADWARFLGIAFAILNAIVQLSWFAHFPLWSGAVLILDLLVIYALTVHDEAFA